MNISSAVVYSKARDSQTLAARLNQLPGVQVHAVSDDGKLVVSIESDSDFGATDTYKMIEQLDGVLSVAMIFQQSECNPDQELTLCK